MRFNTNQKDAFAKVLDSIGTANVVAILVGTFAGTGSTGLSLLNGIMLGFVSVYCFACAAMLRK